MNKMFIRATFVALLSASGCANPMSRLFAKKPQPFDEYLAERRAKASEVASRLPQSGQPGSAVIADLLNAGNAAMQRGALAEAQGHYLSVLQRQPNHPTANHRLGVIADQQRNFSAAERYYQTALSAAPRDASLLNDLGYSYLLQSRFDEAERYLNQSLQLNPTQSNAVNNLASLHLQRGQHDHALSILRRTLTESEAHAKLAQLKQTLPATVAQTTPPSGWPSNGASPANQNSYGVPSGANQFAGNSAPAAAINVDPSLPDATRQLYESMEAKRRLAIAERNARDAAEKAQRDALVRQNREAEFGRTSIVPVGNQTRAGAAQGVASGVPMQSPNSPIYIGPQSTNPAAQQLPPGNDAAQYGIGVSSLATSANPAANPQFSPGNFGTAANFGGAANPALGQAVPIHSQQLPNESMSAWPPQESFGSIPRLPNPTGNAGTSAPSGAGPFTPGASLPEDPARAAARVGMSAGPGSLFPMVPPSQVANQNFNSMPNAVGVMPNSVGAMPNSVGPAGPSSNSYAMPRGSADGIQLLPYSQTVPADQTPAQFEALPNQYSWPNMPPQIPQNGIPSSAIDPRDALPPNWSESPTQLSAAQFALQGQIAPSAQFQTPSPFGLQNPMNGPNDIARQPGVPNYANGVPSSGGVPSPRGEHFGAAGRAGASGFNQGDQWMYGAPASDVGSAISSTPSMQNWIATPNVDQSMGDYEKLVQLHNAETNSIRQQIDTQRQLPSSEQFFRSLANQGASSPSAGPIIVPRSSNVAPSVFSTQSNLPSESTGNTPQQWPHSR